jgi:hypothetical protein
MEERPASVAAAPKVAAQAAETRFAAVRALAPAVPQMAAEPDRHMAADTFPSSFVRAGNGSRFPLQEPE